MRKTFGGLNRSHMALAAAVLALLGVATNMAKATIINLGQVNLSAPFELNGYAFTPLSGTFSGYGNMQEIVAPYGNPNHAYAAGEFEVQVTGGGDFIFNSIDLAFNDGFGAAYFTLTGKLNGSTVASQSGAVQDLSPFNTYSYGSSSEIDSLFVSVSVEGDPGNSVQLYNLNVSSGVPDYASTAGLLALAMAPLIFVRIRQHRQITTA